MKCSVRTGVAILLAVSLVAVAALSYAFPTVSPPGSRSSAGNSSPSGSAQQIAVSGTVNLKVYAPGGALVATYDVPDPIWPDAVTQIVGCVLGSNGGISAGSTPFGTCSGWINLMNVDWDSPSGTCTAATEGTAACSYASGPVKNYPEPIGCSLQLAASNMCTGWESQAVFGPGTFTASNCGSSCKVEEIYVGLAAPNGGLLQSFDEVCSATFLSALGCLPSTIATVSPGQTLVVTITYTIS